MRIGQVAPLIEAVPPKLYGGTERVVSYLTEELVRLGHEVTLFASGDSSTGARLVPVVPQALRLAGVRTPEAFHVLLVEEAFSRADELDVIHFHLDYLHLPLARRAAVPHVTTLHGRLDLPELAPLFGRFADAPLVSISDAQRAPLSFACWQATVHHGLPRDLYRPGEGRGGYLAFLGRVSPEKGLDAAIRIARRAGRELRVAAKVDQADRAYHQRRIARLLRGPGVEFVGEIGDADKGAFLGDAVALLFPIEWPEPFGIVMIEALACGTPVIAFRSGSVPEVIDEGATGFVVDGVAAAVRAVQRVAEIDRSVCRATFERRFTSERMALDYLAVYGALTSRDTSIAA